MLVSAGHQRGEGNGPQHLARAPAKHGFLQPRLPECLITSMSRLPSAAEDKIVGWMTEWDAVVWMTSICVPLGSNAGPLREGGIQQVAVRAVH
jgi:hypothetical protein